VRKTLLSMLAVALLLGAGNLVWAQDSSTAGMKPIVTVGFSGYDEVLKDVEHIGNLTGNAQLAQMVEGQLNEAAGGLAGLDKQKPWGLVVAVDESKLGAGGGPPGMPFGPGMLSAFQGYAFVPVTDLKQLLGALQPMVGDPADAGNGVLKIDSDGQPLFLKEQSGWVFVSTSPEMLASTPADPVPLLGGLNESYDLAVRITLANLPESLREGILGMMQMMTAMRRPGETDEQHAMRSKMAEQTMEQMTTALNELDALTVGLAVDRAASTASFEYVAGRPCGGPRRLDGLLRVRGDGEGRHGVGRANGPAVGGDDRLRRIPSARRRGDDERLGQARREGHRTNQDDDRPGPHQRPVPTSRRQRR